MPDALTPEQQQTVREARRRGVIARLRAVQTARTERAGDAIAALAEATAAAEPVQPGVLRDLADSIGTAFHARNCANLIEQYPLTDPRSLVEGEGERYLRSHGGNAELASSVRAAVAAADAAAERGWSDPEAADDDEAALLEVDDAVREQGEAEADWQRVGTES